MNKNVRRGKEVGKTVKFVFCDKTRRTNSHNYNFIEKAEKDASEGGYSRFSWIKVGNFN